MHGRWISAGCRRFSGGWLALLVATACGPGKAPGNVDYARLQPLAPALLQPNVSWKRAIVGKGAVPSIAVVDGQLPDGLELGDDGTLRGTPDKAGEWQRFTLEARDADGEPLGQQSYALAVTAQGTNLPAPSTTQTGDVVAFEQDWGKPIFSGFAFDPTLNLLWPLRAAAGVNGHALASPGGKLDLVVAGPDAQGAFEVATPGIDPRIGLVVQLTWNASADVDLRILPEPGLGGGEVSEASPEFDKNGAWQAKFESGDTSAPGPEVAVLAQGAPAGRYAIVATKAGGDDVKIPAWLSIRGHDGTMVAEQRFDLFLSDVAGSSVADDVTKARQSYACLGVVVIGTDGNITLAPPPDSRDPLAKTAPEAQ